MKLRTKLTIGFGLLFALIAGSTVMLIDLTSRMVSGTHHTQISNDQLVDALELSAAVAHYLDQRRMGELGHDPHLADASRAELQALLVRAQQRLLDPQVRAAVDGDEEEQGEADRMVVLGDLVARLSNDPSADEDDRVRVRALVSEIVADESGEADESFAEAVVAAARARTWSLGICLLGALAVAALMFFIIRPALRALRSLNRAAASIAGGDLTVSVAVESSAELADLGRQFNVMARQIQRSHRTLDERNRELETTMQDLEKAQAQLIALSRHAGRAEVASGVLHNVGNVLNSVNVSVELLTDGLNRLGELDVGRAIALLEEHRGDLTAYVNEDPRGARVLPYLRLLGERLRADAGKMGGEAASLRGHVDHLKVIINKQQGHARTLGVVERCDPNQLADDALALIHGSMVTTQVEVVRDYGELPPIFVDRHRVLTILVNLLSNGKHAVGERPCGERRLTLRTRGTDEHLEVEVEDNGVGIAAENLVRVFGHGFTTKKDGHGFGLHASALAAREMSGALTCHSPGPGLGAVFTLKIPLQKPSEVTA